MPRLPLFPPRKEPLVCFFFPCHRDPPVTPFSDSFLCIRPLARPSPPLQPLWTPPVVGFVPPRFFCTVPNFGPPPGFFVTSFSRVPPLPFFFFTHSDCVCFPPLMIPDDFRVFSACFPPPFTFLRATGGPTAQTGDRRFAVFLSPDTSPAPPHISCPHSEKTTRWVGSLLSACDCLQRVRFTRPRVPGSEDFWPCLFCVVFCIPHWFHKREDIEPHSFPPMVLFFFGGVPLPERCCFCR